ncbi:hypothetical protein B0H14DRAFT_2568928 [Mycena olivaceomarginata]|nr:hypothetical protein B0H14DRAFT_2568928 [Mycena olivaceomarginata]
MDNISALWNRPTGSSDNDWTFWQSFAATCLSDTDISTMLEGSTVWTYAIPSNTESILIEPSSCARAMCMRYLGGILDLTGFWSEMRNVHAHVANKLCLATIRVLKDIGVDILTLGPIHESVPPFDYDGVDSLATTLLMSFSGWFKKLNQEEWSVQPWYDTLCQLVRLLQMPRAAEMLPQSSGYATTISEDILPIGYRNTELNATGVHSTPLQHFRTMGFV